MKVALSPIVSSPDNKVWANPTNIADRLRYHRSMSTKNVGSDKVENVRQELIHNRTVPVALCDKKCAGEEVLSVRTSISGSFKSRDEMVRLLNDHVETLKAFIQASEHYGFGPGSDFAPSLSYKD